MKKAKKPRMTKAIRNWYQKATLEDWLKFIEAMIEQASTKPRTRGKYKGHGSTDTMLWTRWLTMHVQTAIRIRAGRGIGYDENMAMAAQLGLLLVAWFTNVQRAKSLDPNRPLALRRRAQKHRDKYLRELFSAVQSDKLMASTWGHQEFNVPYGKKARGGKFV